MNVTLTIQEKLKDLRTSRGLNLEQLAELHLSDEVIVLLKSGNITGKWVNLAIIFIRLYIIFWMNIDVRSNVRYNKRKKGVDFMTAISVTKARENIYQILADVNHNSQPITITNSRGKNGVLISEADWNAIQETLFLNSIPGMTESILPRVYFHLL